MCLECYREKMIKEKRPSQSQVGKFEAVLFCQYFSAAEFSVPVFADEADILIPLTQYLRHQYSLFELYSIQLFLFKYEGLVEARGKVLNQAEEKGKTKEKDLPSRGEENCTYEIAPNW